MEDCGSPIASVSPYSQPHQDTFTSMSSIAALVRMQHHHRNIAWLHIVCIEISLSSGQWPHGRPGIPHLFQPPLIIAYSFLSLLTSPSVVITCRS